MPTYEYKCSRCGSFEMWQSMKDEPLKNCPKCGSPAERLISAGAGFVLKGAGFYQNDYKNAPAPAPACGGGACDSKPAGSGEGCCGGGGCCGA